MLVKRPRPTPPRRLSVVSRCEAAYMYAESWDCEKGSCKIVRMGVCVKLALQASQTMF